MAGVELLVIEESTDVQTFAKEVRWNELYWRLA
jgi:L-arabinose isomerase